jgi:hypothetical protein
MKKDKGSNPREPEGASLSIHWGVVFLLIHSRKVKSYGDKVFSHNIREMNNISLLSPHPSFHILFNPKRS